MEDDGCFRLNLHSVVLCSEKECNFMYQNSMDRAFRMSVVHDFQRVHYM
jgi:hypothetical protein